MKPLLVHVVTADSAMVPDYKVASVVKRFINRTFDPSANAGNGAFVKDIEHACLDLSSWDFLDRQEILSAIAKGDLIEVQHSSTSKTPKE